jgi:hypothetical protein
VRGGIAPGRSKAIVAVGKNVIIIGGSSTIADRLRT